MRCSVRQPQLRSSDRPGVPRSQPRRVQPGARAASWVGVLLVGVVASGCGSGSAGTPGPTVEIPRGSVVKAGTCDPIVRMCSRLGVAQWVNVAYTPLIRCGWKAGVKCRLKMDITAPTSGGPWPVIVFVPGGPSPPDERYSGELDSFVKTLAGQGAVVMVAGWREGPDWGGGYPRSFQDVACAIGVARKIAPAYGGSADRVTLQGHSTGGWPAAVVGLTPTPFTPARGSCDATAGSLRPDAVVVEDGELNEVTQPDKADGLWYVTDFLGGDRTKRPERLGGGGSIRPGEALPGRRQGHQLPPHPRLGRFDRAPGRLREVPGSAGGRRLPQPARRDPACGAPRRSLVAEGHRADREGRDTLATPAVRSDGGA